MRSLFRIPSRLPTLSIAFLTLLLLPLQAARAANTFSFRLVAEPETLDWNRAHSAAETHLLMNLMEGLVGFDSQLKLVPALAQSWQVSEDGRTFTFKLRPGVKWSDGVPLKAQDFVYSWKRLLSPFTAAPYAYFLFDIEGAEFFNQGKIDDFSDVGVKALDDLTLRVKLARPVAHWLQLLTFWVTFPLREDIVQKHGEGWARPGRMVTLGPFMLSSYEADSKVVLRKNPSYYGRAGNLDEVTAIIIRDDATAVSLFEAGKLDLLTSVGSLDLKRFQGGKELRFFPYLKTVYLGFKLPKYPASLKGVRLAIARAIDRSQIPALFGAGQKAGSSFVPPGMAGHFPQMGLKFDPEQAKRDLATAGFGISRPLKLELLCGNFDKSLLLMQYVQGQLKKNLGAEVTLVPFDNKTYRQQLTLATYPVFEALWAADLPDPDNFLSIFLSRAGTNHPRFKNAAFDEKILEGRNVTDPKVRERIYQSLQKTLIEEEVVMVPLYHDTNTALIKARAKGVFLNPLNYLVLRDVSVSP
jgi:oligopeptide transport system substrate-binding protein